MATASRHLCCHVRRLSTAVTVTSDTAASVTKQSTASTTFVYNQIQNSKTRTVDTERDEVTQLVDRLFERTRQLMTTTDPHKKTIQSEDKKDYVEQYHHTVAYSGGIDSSLVAAVVYQVSLDLNDVGSTGTGGSATTDSHRMSTTTVPPQHHHVTAVLGISPAVSMEQIRLAEDVAVHIGVPFVKIPTEEGTDEMYIANNGQACFACKSELYTKLIHHTIASYTTQHGSNHANNHRTPKVLGMQQQPQQSTLQTQLHQKLYNGTNADDCLDSTRVGLIAASQNNVLSPLSNITKEQVRQIAKWLRLPNWNVASNPCLRSRLALGIPATKQHLQRIEQAERYIRQQLDTIITVETNLRVRLLAQQRACLEIDAIFVAAVTDLYHMNQRTWEHVLLQELQFRSFTIRAFRSGSVAATAVSVDASSAVSTKA